MIVYDPRLDEHDLLLAQWWGAMRQAGELASTLGAELGPLGAFMRWCAPPRAVLLETDPDGVAAAAWFEPTLRGAWFGFWLAPRLRHRRTGLVALENALRAGFSNWTLLLAAARRESVGRMLGRLGYTMVGPVPGLLDPDAGAWVGWLTQEAFNGWRGRRQGWGSAKSDHYAARPESVRVRERVRGHFASGPQHDL